MISVIVIRSIQMARENLMEFSRQCEFIHDDYRNIDVILDKLGN